MLARYLVLFLALATTAILASPADSAPKQGKTYNASVETPEWAGATDGAYTITITNTTGTQLLGSANVTIPTATAGDVDFTVTSEPVFVSGNIPGATIARPGGGKVIELRNLSLPAAPAAGSSVTIALGLRMPCVARAYGWGFDARQSNDFSGTPGNTLGPVTGTTDLTVQGSCKLRFDPGQPASAEVSQEITADAFQDDSPNPVAVEAVDGSPDPQRLTWFEDTVELTATGGPGSLSAASPASAGLATFDGLSITLSGNYNLIASAATAPGFSDGESADFQVIDDVGDCSVPGECKASVQAQKSSVNLTGTAVTGYALLSVNLGNPPDCAGYTPPTTDWFEFQLTGVGDKTVEYFYSKAAMKNVSGPSALEICFASPISFVDKDGPPTASFDYDGDRANGAEGFAGLLPDCSSDTPGQPCVQSRTGTAGGGAIVTFFVPKAWGDPRCW